MKKTKRSGKSGKPWTPEEQSQLHKLLREGRTTSEIAEIMERSPNAIYKHKRTHLSNRPLSYYNAIPGKVNIDIKLVENGLYVIHGLLGEKGVDMVYEGKQGVNHVFRSVKGGWRTCYTDQQMIGLMIFSKKNKK